ncbi:UHRF1-binding protein 1 [Fasciola gigantica]|uniref:UHRF1-binding protein 1 n=1 Tax=Fasciola gigantica TaxID=46835 RepID=A0A504YVS1_FASGI|nr:UHRF1-binding protein 1 [Fasciola gigantica]
MFSFFKSQVIKPFLKFTKNLSADQINLSVLKGEGELKSLELDETTLMELLDLPTWLYLRKAHCSDISFKIRWTKLETHPIFVVRYRLLFVQFLLFQVIDRVDVELEALDEPRPVTDSMFASYRTGSGKYRLPDRVVDGATILVNSVFICFCARAFKASIELSRLTLMSKTPQWQNGALNLTTLMFPAGDAVLIFKEISWDSVRIAADGLLSELNGIPVKLITNTGRIRLTLKKRLSGKIPFAFHDQAVSLLLSKGELGRREEKNPFGRLPQLPSFVMSVDV